MLNATWRNVYERPDGSQYLAREHDFREGAVNAEEISKRLPGLQRKCIGRWKITLKEAPRDGR